MNLTFNETEVQQISDLLRETEKAHALHEKEGKPHPWVEWYAHFIVARGAGLTEEEAATAASGAM